MEVLGINLKYMSPEKGPEEIKKEIEEGINEHEEMKHGRVDVVIPQTAIDSLKKSLPDLEVDSDTNGEITFRLPGALYESETVTVRKLEGDVVGQTELVWNEGADEKSKFVLTDLFESMEQIASREGRGSGALTDLQNEFLATAFLVAGKIQGKVHVENHGFGYTMEVPSLDIHFGQSQAQGLRTVRGKLIAGHVVGNHVLYDSSEQSASGKLHEAIQKKLETSV